MLNPIDGRDILADKFEYLRRRVADASTIYQDALARVMHTFGGGLQLCDLRGSEGELGLKADGSDDYFGVIYIGDTTAFKRLVETDGTGVVVVEDALQGSLFDRINEPDSTIEVLAGARKFIEGWELLASVQHGHAEHRAQRRFADNPDVWSGRSTAWPRYDAKA